MSNISENSTNKVTSILKALQGMPKIFRWISIIALSVCLAAAALGLTSCGLTRATVQNRATGTVTEIKITTSNPTSGHASPNLDIPFSYGKKNETP